MKVLENLQTEYFTFVTTAGNYNGFKVIKDEEDFIIIENHRKPGEIKAISKKYIVAIEQFSKTGSIATVRVPL